MSNDSRKTIKPTRPLRRGAPPPACVSRSRSSRSRATRTPLRRSHDRFTTRRRWLNKREPIQAIELVQFGGGPHFCLVGTTWRGWSPCGSWWRWRGTWATCGAPSRLASWSVPGRALHSTLAPGSEGAGDDGARLTLHDESLRVYPRARAAPLPRAPPPPPRDPPPALARAPPGVRRQAHAEGARRRRRRARPRAPEGDLRAARSPAARDRLRRRGRRSRRRADARDRRESDWPRGTSAELAAVIVTRAVTDPQLAKLVEAVRFRLCRRPPIAPMRRYGVLTEGGADASAAKLGALAAAVERANEARRAPGRVEIRRMAAAADGEKAIRLEVVRPDPVAWAVVRKGETGALEAARWTPMQVDYLTIEQGEGGFVLWVTTSAPDLLGAYRAAVGDSLFGDAALFVRARSLSLRALQRLGRRALDVKKTGSAQLRGARLVYALLDPGHEERSGPTGATCWRRSIARSCRCTGCSSRRRSASTSGTDPSTCGCGRRTWCTGSRRRTTTRSARSSEGCRSTRRRRGRTTSRWRRSITRRGAGAWR